MGRKDEVLQVKQENSVVEEVRINDVPHVGPVRQHPDYHPGAAHALRAGSAGDLLLHGRPVLRADARARAQERLPAHRAIPPGARPGYLPAIGAAIRRGQNPQLPDPANAEPCRSPSATLLKLKQCAEAATRAESVSRFWVWRAARRRPTSSSSAG